MEELNRCLNPIRSAYPNLRIDSARALTAPGQNNDIVIVNEAIVFRFPRTQEGLGHLAPSVEVLRAIQGRTNLPIPRPIYRSKEWRTVGEAFTGYPLIEGAPLTLEALAAIRDESALNYLASQLAHFLRDLHSVPLEMISIKLAPATGADRWRRMYDEIRERLFPAMTAGARDEATAHFETFLNAPHAFDTKPTLTHGDFGVDNLLWDPETLEITGVVDFDTIGLSDPALDLAMIARDSEALAARMIAVSPDMAALRKRAEFYRGALALSTPLIPTPLIPQAT